jgi:ribonuclease VapC
VIVDPSAVVAILLSEPDAAHMYSAIRSAPRATMSAAGYLEAGIVIDSLRDPVLSRQLDDTLALLDVAFAPVTESRARIARQAYRDFGKGSGHPARLNFGDCFSYALAVESGEPLLYKGDDFVHTDVRSALG